MSDSLMCKMFKDYKVCRSTRGVFFIKNAPVTLPSDPNSKRSVYNIEVLAEPFVVSVFATEIISDKKYKFARISEGSHIYVLHKNYGANDHVCFLDHSKSKVLHTKTAHVSNPDLVVNSGLGIVYGTVLMKGMMSRTARMHGSNVFKDTDMLDCVFVRFKDTGVWIPSNFVYEVEVLSREDATEQRVQVPPIPTPHESMICAQNVIHDTTAYDQVVIKFHKH